MKHHFLLRMVLFITVLCAGFVVAFAQERQPAMQLNGHDNGTEKISILEKPAPAQQSEAAAKEQLVLDNMPAAEREAYLIKQKVSIKAQIANADPIQLRNLYFSDRAAFLSQYGAYGEEIFLNQTEQNQSNQRTSGTHQISQQEFDSMPVDKQNHILANPAKYEITNQTK